MWTPPQNHWGGLWLIKKRCTDYFSVRGFGADFPSLIVRLNLNLMIPKLSSIWKVLVFDRTRAPQASHQWEVRRTKFSDVQ